MEQNDMYAGASTMLAFSGTKACMELNRSFNGTIFWWPGASTIYFLKLSFQEHGQRALQWR
jgi:hypothetical protein